VHSQKSGEPLLTLGSLRLNGWAHSLLGDHAAAAASIAQAQQLQRSLAVAELLGDWFEAAEAETALLAGDVERARACAEQLVPRLRAEERFVSLGLAEQVLGLALGRAGLKDPTTEQADEADAHLAAGLAVFEASEQRMAAAILRLYWGALCRLRGDSSRAALHHERALDQLERSGCVHLLAGITAVGAALLSGGLTS
jgi:tetratricopeptide (TPR) repeat protein